MQTKSNILPMRIVCRLTGLSPDLVRAWERRYGAIEPARTEGNARRYSHADVERLLRLRAAVAKGHAISSLAPLSNEQLDSLVAADGPSGEADPRALIERYIDAISALELQQAEQILVRAVRLASPRQAVFEVLAPLIGEIGMRWHEGRLSVAQEHAASAQIRAVASSLLLGASVDLGAPRVIVAAPEHHRHELGALLASVLVVERRLAPLYLGPDVPWAELASAARATKARLVVLSMPLASSGKEATAERAGLRRLAKDVEVWVGAPPASREPIANVRFFADYAVFETALAHRFAI